MEGIKKCSGSTVVAMKQIGRKLRFIELIIFESSGFTAAFLNALVFVDGLAEMDKLISCQAAEMCFLSIHDRNAQKRHLLS